MKLLRIIIGIGIVVFGFAIYPYYVTYILTPLTDMIATLFPTMNLWEETYMAALPLIVLLLILFFGIMTMLGKAGQHREE